MKSPKSGKSRRGREKDLLRRLDRVWEKVASKQRRKNKGKRRKLLKKAFPKSKPVIRSLSQIDFRAQQWWGEGQVFKSYVKQGETGRKMQVQESKAAAIYEAYRRHPAVQQVWIDGKFALKANGWQPFVGLVIGHLAKSWADLNKRTQQTFVDQTLSPFFLPPRGYSTFPDKSEPADCEKVTLQIFRLPPRGNPGAAQHFVERLREFEEAGFVFAGIDHKSAQRDAYALRALKKRLKQLPVTYRKQDCRTVVEHRVPDNTSVADKQTLDEKARQGLLTRQDLDNIWKKYLKPTSDPFADWSDTTSAQTFVVGKRKRGPVLIEARRFDLPKLFQEFADLDNGIIQKSDFVQRLRFY
jgi:hypothetical protein